MIAFKRPSPSPTGVNTLVIASAGIQLASGFFGTFLSLRVALEHFDPTIAGLVLSSYFAGYTIGALRSQIIIERIGHIRSYVACAGLAVAATSAMPLFTGAMPWIILRGIIGFGCAGLFVTTESWLSCKTEPAERGRIFARYMVGNFIALALGQLLIIQARVETMAPFRRYRCSFCTVAHHHEYDASRTARATPSSAVALREALLDSACSRLGVST